MGGNYEEILSDIRDLKIAFNGLNERYLELYTRILEINTAVGELNAQTKSVISSLDKFRVYFKAYVAIFCRLEILKRFRRFSCRSKEQLET